jgi:hypothetical protein
MKALIRVVATAAILATACTPFATKKDLWVGFPIDRYLDIYDTRARIEETRGPDARGNKIYVERIEKQCRVYWDVDAGGIITGWRSEGSACKHYWQ